MNENDFPFVVIPEHLTAAIGEPVRDTRMYERRGQEEEYREWWDAVCEICGEESSVSPGGASMYVQVSRAGVHKRMKEGRITAFLFYPIKGISRWTKREKLANYGLPYIYIPGIELRAWAEMMEKKKMSRAERAREALGDGDFRGTFLRAKGRKVKK